MNRMSSLSPNLTYLFSCSPLVSQDPCATDTSSGNSFFLFYAFLTISVTAFRASFISTLIIFFYLPKLSSDSNFRSMENSFTPEIYHILEYTVVATSVSLGRSVTVYLSDLQV